MPWPIRMNWCTVATIDILHQGDKHQSMGTKEIMVGHGQHDNLISTAYGKILQDPADECIDWYASVIKKAWEDRPKPAQLKELQALEKLLHCRRQQLIRKAASRGGTLELDNGFEWVCTSSIAEIDKNKVAQGYYHFTETGEKRE
jgi:hypothetical protein